MYRIRRRIVSVWIMNSGCSHGNDAGQVCDSTVFVCGMLFFSHAGAGSVKQERNVPSVLLAVLLGKG